MIFFRFVRATVSLFCLLFKKGDMTVIRNFENAIVLKVKIMKKPKVEVASYNRVLRRNNFN